MKDPDRKRCFRCGTKRVFVKERPGSRYPHWACEDVSCPGPLRDDDGMNPDEGEAECFGIFHD